MQKAVWECSPALKQIGTSSKHPVRPQRQFCEELTPPTSGLAPVQSTLRLHRQLSRDLVLVSSWPAPAHEHLHRDIALPSVGWYCPQAPMCHDEQGFSPSHQWTGSSPLLPGKTSKSCRKLTPFSSGLIATPGGMASQKSWLGLALAINVPTVVRIPQQKALTSSLKGHC